MGAVSRSLGVSIHIPAALDSSVWLTRALARGFHVFGCSIKVWHSSNLGAAHCKTFKSGIWSMTLMLFWICQWTGWAATTKGSFGFGVPETFELKQSKLSCEINVRVDDRLNWFVIDWCLKWEVWSSMPSPFLPKIVISDALHPSLLRCQWRYILGSKSHELILHS